MTLQEGALIVERLNRIWEVDLSVDRKLRWSVVDPILQYRVFIDSDLRLVFNCNNPDISAGDYFLTLCRAKGRPILVCSTREFGSRTSGPFEQNYMPLFRRNCWLLGFDIAASAPEKAEWIQGFAREEIEQWNLKF
ncbi:hypothetical protein IAD21_03811 [Abditibacteriota bacterium]|nr:hypothetical protein IAD21_03811 [Abditibacteriota bacterium]